LHAVLYNIMAQDEWHTHNEVNGLAISGYGNRLMVNGGRLGEPTRAASLNNTLTINGENHKTRVGNGIVEGFTTAEFDYSSGHSGSALGSAVHLRNLILVHGFGFSNPYFIVFDEVEAQAGDQVKNYLHPANQSAVSTIASGMEYDAAIDHYPTKNGTKLAFFFGTPPTEVNIEKVASAVPDRYPGYPDHNRLEAVYDADDQGKVSIQTVLFPYDGTIQKPQMLRISETGFSGSSIDQGNALVDILLESSGDQEVSHDGISFNGKSMVSRTSNSNNKFYFIRQGSKYDQGGIGFESDAPITIYAKEKEGVIVSDGAKVKLNGPGMNAIKFNPSVTIIDSGDTFIEVQMPAGTIRFASQ
jgi:hypothetical protein